jgi:FAD/FMN-containing dehydrogenase
MFSEDDLGLMRRISSAVDPEHLANRGKMLRPEAVG